IADQRVEYQTPDILADAFVARFRCNHVGDISVVSVLVFSVWEYAEDLREVFHVDGFAVIAPIKALDDKGVASKLLDAFREAFYFSQWNKAHFRHINADHARKRHHRIFV